MEELSAASATLELVENLWVLESRKSGFQSTSKSTEEIDSSLIKKLTLLLHISSHIESCCCTVVFWLLSCVRLFWDPMICSLPGFSVHGIAQTRILEWITFSFSRGSSQLRDQTASPALADRLFTNELRGKAHLAFK